MAGHCTFTQTSSLDPANSVETGKMQWELDVTAEYNEQVETFVFFTPTPLHVSCRSPGADYDIVGGDRLGCQFNSILQTTGLQYRDFIYVSFHNQVWISLVFAGCCL